MTATNTDAFDARYADYLRYREALAVTPARAAAIVAEAQLRAQSLLADLAWHVGPDGLLPVEPRVIPAAQGRYGYLLPAWPEPDKRPVPLYVVPSFGLLAYLWRGSIGEPEGERAAVTERFLSGERLWVGLANDVLQPFVPAPPAGTYRMYRHHALMLYCATTWLPPVSRDGWLRLYDHGARRAIARHGLATMRDPIAWLDAADARASAFYDSYGARVSTEDTVRAFLAEPEHEEYTLFFSVSNIGISALAAQSRRQDAATQQGWLRHMVNVAHADPDFLVDAVSAFIRTSR